MIRWVSIQSLAGGMMLGAEQAFGCPPLFTIDYEGVSNSDAYLYYMNEIRHVGLRQLKLTGNLLSGSEDFVTQEDEDFFYENNRDIDVVVSVPICSGLSICTTASARGGDAVRNDNMLNISKFVFGRIKPKAYIFENAPALFTTSGKKVRDKLEELASEYNYSVTFVKTDTKYHSNVQHRERTFCIFWKDTCCPVMSYVHTKPCTILDYLSDISPDAKYNTKEYELFKDFDDNGYIKYLRKKFGPDYIDKWPYKKAFTGAQLVEYFGDYDLAKSVMSDKETKFIDHIVEKRQSGGNYFDSTPVYKGPDNVPVIFGKTLGALVHPSGTRGYTVREAMKFMGLPDDYEIPDVMKHLAYIGQNVPVLTARDWCLQIKDYLEGKKSITIKSVDMFNNTKEIENKFVFGHK